MKFKTIKEFKIKGESIGIGQIISLPKDAAIKALELGYLEPVEPFALKIYSNLLQVHIWLVDSEQSMNNLLGQGITEPIYTTEEIEKLKVMSNAKEQLKIIHEIKSVFKPSKVISVEPRDKEGKKKLGSFLRGAGFQGEQSRDIRLRA